MAPPVCAVSSILRAFGFTVATTAGSIALAASCSSASPASADASADASGDGTNPNEGGASEEATASCPRASIDADRCSTNDSAFVFFPALVCDPSSHDDAGGGDGGPTADAAGQGSEAGVDPCALVTTLSVFFTPQACRAFVMAQTSGNTGKDTDPAAPVIDEPADGDMLTPDNWSIFVWHPVAPDARRGPLERALAFLEPEAYAYSPLGGDAYALVFSQGCTEVLRVMLTGTFWEPDPASWALLTSLAGPVQIRVFHMRFAADSLVSKPVPSAPIAITMQNNQGG